MKPHIFKSVIHKGAWCCCTKVKGRFGRPYEPGPTALLVYGTSPCDAYKRWKEYYVGRT